MKRRNYDDLRDGTVTSNGARKRQASYNARMRAAGFKQVTGWVHKEQSADAGWLLKRLKGNPDLRPGPVRDVTTGRLAKLEAQDKEEEGE